LLDSLLQEKCVLALDYKKILNQREL